jgi:phosphoglycerate dehydrogenase-like enzyme
MKVLIAGGKERYQKLFPDFAKDLPVELVFCARDASPEEMAAACPDAGALLVDAITPVSAQAMDLLPQVKLIHSEGVAYSAIDTAAAKERGIYVCNNAGCNAAPVAELAIMLMLMLTRLALSAHRAVREGRQIQFKENIMQEGGLELGELSVGLVGFGDIGQAAARRLKPFGCPLYYYAPHRRPEALEEELGASYLPLEELAARCDVVMLACSVNESTKGMVNRDFLARMKSGAFLINTSRGELIDNLALREALLEGKIAGAGLDTIAPEPTPADHPLVDLPEHIRDRVICTAHLGGITEGSFRRAHTNIWNNVRLILEGKRPVHVVN